MIYLLFIINTLLTTFSVSCLKIYRNRIRNENVKDNIQYISGIVVSLFVYGAITKFDIRVNLITLIYSAGYALAAYLSVVLNMRAMENADLVTISIFTDTGSVLWNVLWGILIFGENINTGRVFAIIMVLVTVIIQFFAERTKANCNMKGIIYCFLIFITSSLSTIIIKLYSATESVASNNIFLFYTNIFMIPFAFFLLKKVGSVKGICTEAVHIIKTDKKAIFILLSSFILNIMFELLRMIIVTKVDLIVYGVAEKAFKLLIMAIVSRILFKEKITASKLISSLLFIIAVIIVA